MFNSSKKKPPLKVKAIEEMPHTIAGMKYKEWHEAKPKTNKWRNIRWGVLVSVNLLFMVSYLFGLSVLEGSLSGSRAFGFYLMDSYNALQVMIISLFDGYFWALTMNFWIGFFTIILLSILGGRSYCSWVCPYHLLAEFGEKLHDYFVKKKKIKEHTYSIYLHYVFWIGFLIIALVTKNIVFEDINPVGIISRSLIYGPSIALLWVFLLLLFEITYSKRFWCRYACPIGATWAITGKAALLDIKFEFDKCAYCRDCQDVCLVPHALWFVEKGKATQEIHYTGSDCTRCGLCVDICSGDALSFTVKGIDKIL